jgi:spore maturation protein CgeB
MNPRILYVGQLFPGATALQRMQAFREIGCVVTPFDTMRYIDKLPPLRRLLAYRLEMGPAIAAFNRALVKAAIAAEFDWLWIDKGTWVRPRTLEEIRKRTAAKLVHYTPDAAIVLNRTRAFVDSIPVYDAHVTTKSYELDAYRARGARRILFQQQGYDHHLFRPLQLDTSDEARYAADVTLVAHYQPHYEQTLLRAATVTPNVALWGPDWIKPAARDPRLRNIVRGGPLYMHDYVKALNAAKICLGVLSKRNQDATTTRTFEIPACGAFLLAERTAEHRALYDEGSEAEFYGDLDEMCEKLRHYLKHDDQRCAVAAAGRARCLRDGHTYVDRVRHVFSAAREWGWLPALSEAVFRPPVSVAGK